eukprot:COSAG01_NODE_35302_length_534_cov_0.524138_1_plen_105_part_01
MWNVDSLIETSEADSATDFYEAAIDGYVKTHVVPVSLAQKTFAQVPLMIGFTADDGLGSAELEQHMFETNDLDFPRYRNQCDREQKHRVHPQGCGLGRASPLLRL